MPRARKSQRLLAELWATRWKMSEPRTTPGIPVARMMAEGAPRDLTAPDLHGNDDEFDGGGIGEGGTDSFCDRDVEKEDEQGRNERAGADAGDGDERCDCESEEEFHGDLR